MSRALTSRFAPLAGAFVVLALLAPSARAELVTNGSFEAPFLSAGTAVSIPAGSNQIAPWTIFGPGSGGAVEVALIQTAYTEPGLTFNSAGGVGNFNALDLTGGLNVNTNNAISQTLNMIGGTQYVLSFALGNAFVQGSSSYSGTASSVLVSISNTTASGGSTFSNTLTTPGLINWANQTLTFTANGTGAVTGTLTFTNNQTAAQLAANHYVGLDLITIPSSVPEPGTLTLAAAGLPLFLGLSWLRRRFSR
jgi:hypothetical protein